MEVRYRFLNPIDDVSNCIASDYADDVFPGAEFGLKVYRASSQGLRTKGPGGGVGVGGGSGS